MKRKGLVITALLVLTAVVAVAIEMNKPYKATSTVMCGDNWSASVQNGGELILNLSNKNESGKWSIVSRPEMFASDYNTPLENGIEYHIIALNDGAGDMEIHFTKDDGTIEKYILSVSISRHKKHYLQIDSVSFIEKQ